MCSGGQRRQAQTLHALHQKSARVRLLICGLLHGVVAPAASALIPRQAAGNLLV